MGNLSDVIKWKHFPRYWLFVGANPPVTGGFASPRPARRSFNVFFDLPLNKRLSKQSRRRWFETPLRLLWRHCNELYPVTLHIVSVSPSTVNTLMSRQNCRHFADDIFKCISWNKNVWISLKITLKFVPNVRNNNIPALVQIMARYRPGHKPTSEPMVVSLLTHIYVTRPQSLLQTLIQ